MCGSGGGNSSGGRGAAGREAANVSTSNIIGGRGSSVTEKVGETESAGSSFGRSMVSRIGGMAASAIGGPVAGFAASKGIDAMTAGAVGTEAAQADAGKAGNATNDSNRRALAATSTDDETNVLESSTANASAASTPAATAVDDDSKARTQTILAGSGIAKNKLKTRLGS